MTCTPPISEGREALLNVIDVIALDQNVHRTRCVPSSLSCDKDACRNRYGCYRISANCDFSRTHHGDPTSPRNMLNSVVFHQHVRHLPASVIGNDGDAVIFGIEDAVVNDFPSARALGDMYAVGLGARDAVAADKETPGSAHEDADAEGVLHCIVDGR